MKPKAKGYYYNALMHTFNRLRVKNVHQEKEREREKNLDICIWKCNFVNALCPLNQWEWNANLNTRNEI